MNAEPYMVQSTTEYAAVDGSTAVMMTGDSERGARITIELSGSLEAYALYTTVRFELARPPSLLRFYLSEVQA